LPTKLIEVGLQRWRKDIHCITLPIRILYQSQPDEADAKETCTLTPLMRHRILEKAWRWLLRKSRN